MTASQSEDVLQAMAEVMERQARVARAEAALAAARRRLGEAMARLSSIARERGEKVDLPPLAVPGLQLDQESLSPAAPEEERPGTLRQRIVAVMEASPGEVFTPALLAPLVGSNNRDSVRNTLLVLAAQGQIQKLGIGQYQARKGKAGEP